ncbi:MAG: DMP19 family protein [Candidatus Kapabacteria bacterium]|nr:DMP19 family protein [Candidatus Kapabacteria bacterium]
MNIFKKIFGGSVKSDDYSGNTKPDIDKLINSDNINRSIIELNNYISELCEYGNCLDKLTDPQKYFYYNQNLEREINNGGFNQFYINSAGDFAHETIDSLRKIGANKTAKLVEQANDQFPDKTVPKDRITRQEILSLIEEIANEIWDELDQKFFVYEDDLNSLNMDYIKKNKSAFL